MGGDIPELDDCEEDDHFGAEEEWADPVWTGYAPEQIEEFKILGARLEEEEVKPSNLCKVANMSKPCTHTKAVFRGGRGIQGLGTGLNYSWCLAMLTFICSLRLSIAEACMMISA